MGNIANPHDRKGGTTGEIDQRNWLCAVGWTQKFPGSGTNPPPVFGDFYYQYRYVRLESLRSLACNGLTDPPGLSAGRRRAAWPTHGFRSCTKLGPPFLFLLVASGIGNLHQTRKCSTGNGINQHSHFEARLLHGTWRSTKIKTSRMFKRHLMKGQCNGKEIMRMGAAGVAKAPAFPVPDTPNDKRTAGKDPKLL